MAEHLTITPSGIGILFEDGEPDENGRKKRREYRVAPLAPDAADAPDDPAVREVLGAWVRENGKKLPSVTTVCGMLEKPGLPYAAEKLTVEGCLALARQGKLPQNVEAALGQMWQNELRFRQVWDKTSERGKLTHEDLVHIFAGRQLPPLESYPESQRKFAQGLARFLSDFRPRIVESETMVASLEHGYAGRPDAVVELGITQLPDGSGPAPIGPGLLDLKSHEKFPRTKPSATYPDGNIKTPYPENHIQVGLYETARRESGFHATAWRGVVAVDANGEYDFCVSWIEPEECLALLPAFRVFKSAASRVKTAADQRPVGFEQAELAA